MDASVLTPPHVASERPRAVRVYKIGRKTVQFDNVGPAGRAISETAPRLTNTRTSTVPLLIRARRRMQFARRLIDPCRTLPIAGWLAVLLIYHSSTNDSTWAAVCVCVLVCVYNVLLTPKDVLRFCRKMFSSYERSRNCPEITVLFR